MADIRIIRSAYMVLDPGGANEVDVSAYASSYGVGLDRNPIDVSVIADAIDAFGKGTLKAELKIGIRWPAAMGALLDKMITFCMSNSATTVHFRLSSAAEGTDNPMYEAAVMFMGFDLNAERNASSGFERTYPVNSIGKRTSGSGAFTAITPAA